METLRQSLQDWTDTDCAEHALSLAIGLMSDPSAVRSQAKHVYWSANPVGSALHGALDLFVAAGFLERRDEPDFQYRWRKDFRGSWE